MSSNPAIMNHAERLQAVWKDPATAVATADGFLALMKQEWEDMVRQRDTAARLYGSASDIALTTPPRLVTAEARAAASAAGEVETVSSLVERYRNHPKSPYHTVRFVTRRTYDNNMRRLSEEFGDKPLAEITRVELDEFYKGWVKKGLTSVGNALITIFRILVNFGSLEFDSVECSRLALICRSLEITVPKSSHEPMTLEYAKAIIEKCNEKGWHTVALGQAFQFDCKLHQKDVIGEWVPNNEKGAITEITKGRKKWLWGIRWSEIDNGILTHQRSSGGEPVRCDLRQAPLVQAQLTYFKKKPKCQAIIIDPKTELPFEQWIYTRMWRDAANEAGVPKAVKNMDSRAASDATEQQAEVAAR